MKNLPARLREKLSPQSQRVLTRAKLNYGVDCDGSCMGVVRELLLLVQAQTEALEFECGGMCAQQNPCNAKEALAHADEVMKRLGGEE